MGEILEHLHVQEDMPMVPALILSSDSHVFEPPDLWTTRIDAAFRDRAPRMQRIDGADQLVVEAPETISGQGRFEDVPRGGYDPDQHLKDMELDGVAGEVLYPSQGLFYFRVTDTPLMSAIFRAYNDWLADFCSTDRAPIEGFAIINVDDVQDGLRGFRRSVKRAEVRQPGVVGAKDRRHQRGIGHAEVEEAEY